MTGHEPLSSPTTINYPATRAANLTEPCISGATAGTAGGTAAGTAGGTVGTSTLVGRRGGNKMELQ